MRLTRPIRIVLLSAVLAAALVADVSAATVIHFQPESVAALEAQLRHHTVHAVTLHPTPAPGHVHVSMSDGRHFTVVYAAGEQAHLIALAHANGARYTVAKAKAAQAKTTHHKLRYIVGGIAIVVIVIVVGVLLVDRRRKLREGEGGEGGAPGAPPAGDSAT